MDWVGSGLRFVVGFSAAAGTGILLTRSGRLAGDFGDPGDTLEHCFNSTVRH
ncbi:hypothetical protein GCM10023220_10270 [Streptomyces ziwulingensis]|uniref:Uncharacterized protein n=1 Tax=Streptomyces ziwulingensis TaxID=1045501 RepID=A0ABP9B1D3_9ACTN